MINPHISKISKKYDVCRCALNAVAQLILVQLSERVLH